MYYFKRSFLFDIWQAEGNVIRGCWGRRIAGLAPCLSYSDVFPPVGDLLNLALIWTRMRISDPLMEKVEKFVCTKFLFCSLKKFLNKVQCNPLSQPLLSLFIWNLKVCFPPPLPCWFLFDRITSVAKGRNVPWSHHETPKRRCCIAHQQWQLWVRMQASPSPSSPLRFECSFGLRAGEMLHFSSCNQALVSRRVGLPITSHAFSCALPCSVQKMLFVAVRLVASRLGQASSLLSLEEHYVNRSSSNR